MFIILLFLIDLLPTSTRSEGCKTLNNFIFPNEDLSPTWPKNDICRYQEYPHCCTTSVETVMMGYANTNAHVLFFSHLMKMRDLTAQQYQSLQNFELPYMSEGLRSTALQFKLLDNLSTRRAGLVRQATLQFVGMYYQVETLSNDPMLNLCISDIITELMGSVDVFMQELVFAHQLINTNWQVAQDLFAVVLSSQFSDQCLADLVRAGLTTLSCKTCTDNTSSITTCFDLCIDIATSCLEPFQPVIQLINQWLGLYIKVQDKLKSLIHQDRFQRLRQELTDLIDMELQDDQFYSACRYHFKETPPIQEPQYSIAHRHRRKRVSKTNPPTQTLELRTYSSRPLTFYSTASPPLSKPPVVENIDLFNPGRMCFNATRSVTTWQCWNGTHVGEYDRTRKIDDFQEDTSSSLPSTSKVLEIHLPRLKSKISELVLSLERELIIFRPTEETNAVEPEYNRDSSSTGIRPDFKTLDILIIVMLWIRLTI